MGGSVGGARAGFSLTGVDGGAKSRELHEVLPRFTREVVVANLGHAEERCRGGCSRRRLKEMA